MAEKLKGFFKWFDIPSGSVMGVWSGLLIVLTPICIIFDKDIPNNLMAVYIAALSGKTAHGIMTKKGEQDHAPKDIVG